MSRYSKIVGPLGYAWGYDHPLSEYFFQCFDNTAPSDDENDGTVFSISSRVTLVPHPDTPSKYSYSNSEIMEVMLKEAQNQKQEIVPKEHLDMIASDLPF